MLEQDQSSFFVSDVLKNVLDLDDLIEVENNASISNLMRIGHRELEIELLSMETSEQPQEFCFKLQLKIEALQIADYLSVVNCGALASIDDVSFELQGSDLHWDVRSRIVTCHARLRKGEETV
jgi:hypothetical protein